jgi:hypothetical protein
MQFQPHVRPTLAVQVMLVSFCFGSSFSSKCFLPRLIVTLFCAQSRRRPYHRPNRPRRSRCPRTPRPHSGCRPVQTHTRTDAATSRALTALARRWRGRDLERHWGLTWLRIRRERNARDMCVLLLLCLLLLHSALFVLRSRGTCPVLFLFALIRITAATELV